ncbi:MAG: hypothetical protein WBA23_13120 [Tunicatimonas sp.]|uniref:hypothetical protein n=1 Tax=Tunicatimonas sp. TaxID=1940096 RepID=UPI003C760616
MKKLARLLSVLILCTFSGLSYSQSHTNSVSLPSYSNVKWLYKQGFPVSNYDWDNPEINLYLTEALNYHRQAKLFDGAGIGLTAAGVLLLTAGFGGYMFEIMALPVLILGDYQSNTDLYNALLLAGGASVVGGVALVLGGGGPNRKQANSAAGRARLKFFTNRR